MNSGILVLQHYLRQLLGVRLPTAQANQEPAEAFQLIDV